MQWWRMVYYMVILHTQVNCTLSCITTFLLSASKPFDSSVSWFCECCQGLWLDSSFSYNHVRAAFFFFFFLFTVKLQWPQMQSLIIANLIPILHTKPDSCLENSASSTRETTHSTKFLYHDFMNVCWHMESQGQLILSKLTYTKEILKA